jgi:hypothetical protein
MTAVRESEQEAWTQWLIDNAHVAKYPRILKHLTADSFDLSDEFQYMATAQPIPTLVLLKTYWDKYYFAIERDENLPLTVEPNLSSARIRKKLATVKVPCQDGSSQPLDQTFLPLAEIVSTAQGCVPLITLPNPQDRRWPSVLRVLGVGVKDDLNLYLRALKSLKGALLPSEKVSAFLEQIQARSSEDEVLVR